MGNYMKSLLFLDIDGVCNTDSFTNSIDRNAPLSDKEKDTIDNNPGVDRLDLRFLNPKHIKHLNKIIAKTQAKVVITSDWRIASNAKQFQAMFNHHGFIGEIIGCTKVLNIPRGQEIKDWLDDNGWPDKFAIIDDRDDMDPFMEHLVLTNPSRGLNLGCVQKAIKLLWKE
jgi:hypothetical protein